MRVIGSKDVWIMKCSRIPENRPRVIMEGGCWWRCI